MFSQTIEYALRAVYCLGQTPSEAKTNKHVADAMKIPPSYLAKIMQGLVRAGIVRSRRGVHGGFLLNKDPEDVSLFDVITAIDPMWGEVSCPLELEDHKHAPCPLHSRLAEAMAHIEEAFSDTTLAELFANHA
jgi:Rrf2 family protein